MIDAATLPADGQLLEGRYHLDALLDTIAGRALWRATDLQNQQTVSVQLWDTDASPAEGTLTAARLRQPEDVHPAFAAMEWSGRTREGAAYAVHASLAGRYLDSWLADHALGAADALEIAAELTSALKALHESGQVHGLVGSNVLIMTSTDLAGDQAPTLRIVDTGIESQPAVPHGSAVKAELARTGKLLELLTERVVRNEGAEATAAMASLAELSRRAMAAPDVQPLESMAALDEAVQALATALPGKKQRAGVRKVVPTVAFAGPTTGQRARPEGEGESAAPPTADAGAPAASDDQAALALVLESIEEMPGMAPHDVTDAMSSLLMPASSMPPGLPPDQLLPEYTPSSLALTPTAKGAPIAQPVAPSAPSRPKTGPVSSSARASAPPAGRVVDGGPLVFIIAGLLLLLIALFIFVLLPE